MQPGNRGPGKFYECRSITLYPAERIYEEAAFIAYYAHWSHDDIMEMPHGERSRWCREFSRINRQLNDEPENAFDISGF